MSDTAHVRSLRVGLLTPYAGSNLGDAAIQEALIGSLRRRDPEIELHGINLGPELTSLRHGIPCHLITGLNVPYYSSYYFAARENPASEAAHPVAIGTGNASGSGWTLREWIKGLPGLGPLLRLSAAELRKIPYLWNEVRELRAAWRLLHRLDLLLVAGGGQLDDEWGGPWGHPYALARWASLARWRRVPLAFVSVGSGSVVDPRSRRFFGRALRNADYRSYRDGGTRTELGFERATQQDPVVPDLALGLDPTSRGHSVTAADGDRIVGLSPIAYGHPTIWPTHHPGIHARYLDQFVAFASGLLASGRKLMIFQSSGADRQIVREVVARLVSAQPGATSRIRVPEITTLDDLLAQLASVHTVVTSRLHGVILSHVMRKPCLAISFDRKVDAHMEGMHQERFRHDIHTFEAHDIRASFERLECEADRVVEELDAHLSSARVALDAQLESLMALARSKNS